MKKFDKKTKLTIIFGGLGIILCLIFFLFSHVKSKAIYMVVNDGGLRYQNSSWNNISLTSPIFGKYRFQVYKGNDYKGKYEMNYVNEQWYFFDEKNDSHKFDEGSLFAYYGNVQVESITIESLNDEDIEIIDRAIEKEKFSIADYQDEFTVAEKLVYDFDHDSKLETIYTLDNIKDVVIDSTDIVFSLVVYHDDDYNKILYFDKRNVTEQDDIELFSFNNVIRMNRHKKNYLLLTSTKNLDVSSAYNLVCSFSNKKVQVEKKFSSEMVHVKLTEKDYFGRAIIVILLLGGAITFGVVYFVNRKKILKDEL